MIWQKHTSESIQHCITSKWALWGKPTSCIIHFNINIFIAIICKIKICKCLQDEICSNKFVSHHPDLKCMGCTISRLRHIRGPCAEFRYWCVWLLLKDRRGQNFLRHSFFFLSVTENHLACQQRIRLADRLTVTETRINSANQWQLTRSEPEQTQNRRDSIFFAPPPADLLNCLHLWPLMSVV